MTNVCPEGGKRLINPNGKIQLLAIVPNPADDNIDIQIELIEKTGYKISIVNSIGQTVKEITRTNTSKGITTEKIDVSDLTSGAYTLILQTESERLTESFMIVK